MKSEFYAGMLCVAIMALTYAVVQQSDRITRLEQVFNPPAHVWSQEGDATVRAAKSTPKVPPVPKDPPAPAVDPMDPNDPPNPLVPPTRSRLVET